MSIFLRTVFFVSAFAPAIVVVALLRLHDVGGTGEVLGWLSASALACVLPFLILRAASGLSEQMPFEAKKVESQDWLLVVFVFSYFIPLITKTTDFGLITLIFVIGAILLSTLEAIPCHPLLQLFRFRFYKVEGKNGFVYVLIARRRIITAAEITKVRQLTPQLLMDN